VCPNCKWEGTHISLGYSEYAKIPDLWDPINLHELLKLILFMKCNSTWYITPGKTDEYTCHINVPFMGAVTNRANNLSIAIMHSVIEVVNIRFSSHIQIIEKAK
jgi:hypothetical protein